MTSLFIIICEVLKIHSYIVILPIIFKKAPESCSNTYRLRKGALLRSNEIIVAENGLYLSDLVDFQIYSEQSGNFYLYTLFKL